MIPAYRFQLLRGMRRCLSGIGVAGLTAVAVHALPSISQQPQPVTTSAGRSVSFSIVATGSGPLTYQWRRDGFNLPGATAASFSIPSVSQGDFGAYDVLVNEGQQVVASELAMLRVSPAAFPAILTPDPNTVRLEGNKNGRLARVAVLADGRFYVAGNFTSFQEQRRLALVRCNADGSLDTSYESPAFDGEVNLIVAQPDGRLLVTGNFTTVNGAVSRALARLNADGSQDRTFDVGTGFNWESGSFPAASMALAADGSVFIAGVFTSYQGRTASKIVKLRSTGALDTSFTPPDFFFPASSDLACSADGKLYIVTFDSPGILRTLPDGTRDPSFNVGTGAPAAGVSRVVPLADGKVMVAGSFNNFNGSGVRQLARLLENGSVDRTFAPALPTGQSVTAIARAPSGDFVVGQSLPNATGGRVARLKQDGTVDANFSAPNYGQVTDVAILPNGWTLAAGSTLTSNRTWASIAGLELLDSAGRRTAFDAKLRFPANVHMMRQQGGGKLILAGDFSHWNGAPVASVVRINPDMTLDPTFRIGTGPNDSVLSGTMQPDGKIVLMGYFTQIAGTAVGGLARLNADGSLDTGFRASATIGSTVARPPVVLRDGRIIAISFAYPNEFQVHAPNGTTITNHGFGASDTARVTAAAQLPNGQVLFTGPFATWKGEAKPRMVRLDPDGRVDPGLTIPADGPFLTPSFDEEGRVVQSNGRIVFYTGTGPTVLARRLADGRVDTAFSADVTFLLGMKYLIFGDDRILVWGADLSGRNYVRRLRADGSAEPDFTILAELRGDVSGSFRWNRAAVTDGGDIVAASSNGRLVRYAVVTGPIIATQPAATSRAAGEPATLSVSTVGPAPSTYQWYFNGSAIAGATTATLTLPKVLSVYAGNYHVALTNAFGTTLSAPAAVTVDSAASSLAQLTNMSVRVNLGAAPLIAGFAVEGSGKEMLLRGIGPGLAQFSVAGAAADPRLALYSGSTLVDQNDNWSGGAGLAAATSAVGAFPVPASSLDAMLLRSVGGAHTAQLSATGSGGVALLELYDANASQASTARLKNVSARYQVGTGENILIAGFAITGSGRKALLVRGVGPTLTQFGVANALADPRMAVFSGTNSVAEDNDWGGSAELTAVAASVGAFPLAASSRDAALLLVLPVGTYTVQLFGNAGGTGEGLIEIYEVP